ncbi:hypothetical protein MUP77_18775 [Candidatus Bathyarchaeota archaeon]|nr:hypothetical protein [Candidatus Bathyarchaeota archaeon]
MPNRKENWKGIGLVNVSRDARGRFVHWEFITNLFGNRALSMYGSRVTMWERGPARYEFRYGTSYTGTVRELRDAVAFALHFPPKRKIVVVGAREFLDHPQDYGTRGNWIGRPDIDS